MSSGLLSFCVQSICGKKKDDDDDDDYDENDSVSDTSSVSDTASVTSDKSGRDSHDSGQFQLSSLMPSMSSLRMSSSPASKNDKEEEDENDDKEEEEKVTPSKRQSWLGSISSRLSFGSTKKAEDSGDSSANGEHTRVRVDSHEEMIDGTGTIVDANPDYDDVYASNVGEISALSTATPSTPSDQDNKSKELPKNNNGTQNDADRGELEYKDFSRNASSYGNTGTIVRKSGRSFFINDPKEEKKPFRRLGRAPPINPQKEVEIHYAENPLIQLPIPVKGSAEYDYLDAIIDENSGDKRHLECIKLEASDPVNDKSRLPGASSMAKRRASHAYVQNLHYSSAAKNKTPEEGVDERKTNNDSPIGNGNNGDMVARPKGRRTSVALENMSKQSFISSRILEKRGK